ncbi:MAG: MBL fold metallo-hydrolase [Eubacteriales bacterium]|nr:MBL fold metallo-hydrolase [Eubacteriales bacterium]
MKIQHDVLGMFATNCFLVSGGRPGTCILIDPADEGKRLIARIKKEGLAPEAVLLTHGHYDHFLAVPLLQETWPDLPVYCHPLDCPEEKEEHDMGIVFPTVSAFSHVRPLSDGQRLCLAGFDIAVMHTPGHTPGSVTFFIEDAMFTGDFLFCGSIGRTDFAGGNFSQMKDSLKRLVKVEGEYRVFPGHEKMTTLQREKKENPYLKYL